MERDAATYLQLMEAKDESIVRLTNQLHEFQLQAKIDQVRKISFLEDDSEVFSTLNCLLCCSTVVRRFSAG